MAFIELREFKVVQVIDKKERICLIVKLTMDLHMVFFKDKSFQHIDRANGCVLHEGKMDFIANKHLQSEHANRVVVSGVSEQGGMRCAVIDVEQEYAVEVRDVENSKPQSTTKYHLYESNKEEGNIFIIRVQQNIENGIAVAVFDFWRSLWCEQMIALSSKFLLYHIIPTHNNSELYKQKTDITCHSFALVSSGEKLDSLNYSKIKFCHQMEGGEWILRVKFVITRQLRLKKQMTILGAHQSLPDKMFVIGNAKTDATNANDAKTLPAYVVVNTAAVQNNEPQELRIFNVDFGRQILRSTLIRSVMGVLGQNIIVMLLLPFNKTGFAKLSLNRHEIYFETDCKSPNNPFGYQLSASRDCFYRYELECEPFFEKIKKAPSKIGYSLVKIYDKQAQYTHMIKCAFPALDSFFAKQVLSLL